MKWIKLFESFGSIDFDYINDVCLSLNDYSLKLEDVKEGSAIEMPKDKDIVSDTNDFYYSLSYKSLVLSISSEGKNYLSNKESFYDDLDEIINHLESKFNLKLECIFFDEGFFSGLVYYRYLKDFKNYNKRKYSSNIPFITFDIMFRKLNP